MDLHPINSREELNVNSIVEEKIKQMIPGIVKKVTKVVESRFTKTACLKCEKS